MDKPLFGEIKFLNADEEFERLRRYMNSPDYNIGIDIMHRSRELAKLYAKAKDYRAALGVLRLFVDYAEKVEGMALDNGYYIEKDIKHILTYYNKLGDKKSAALFLQERIETHKDNYLAIRLWEERLETLKKYIK